MPVGENQSQIVNMVSQVLGVTANENSGFSWFKNKHTESDFGKHYSLINEIFVRLNGNALAQQAKRSVSLKPDAYIGGDWNFILEFDEMQHFSSYRLLTLELYPDDLKVGFSIERYKNLCKLKKSEADNYRRKKTTDDFNFEGGRTAQRAYFDCFRDLLPEIHGLNPTLRISEYDFNGMIIGGKESLKKVEGIIANYLEIIKK